MSVDGDGSHDPQTEFHDDWVHQACYIFQPPREHASGVDERPKKKRKISRAEDENAHPIFPRLAGGKESRVCAQLRHETYQQLWAHQRKQIQEVLSQAQEETVLQLIRFVEDKESSLSNEKVPAALVVTGLGTDVHLHILNRLAGELQEPTRSIVHLDASHAPTLQLALKYIIKSTITRHEGVDGYQAFLATHKRLIPMNFDLALLQKFVDAHGFSKLVIAISDVESFDIAVLSELTVTLASWKNRIPFVLVIEVAATVELFERLLPGAVTRILDATVFDLSAATDRLYDAFCAAQHHSDTKLWLGPAVVSTLWDISQDQGASPENFTNAIQYAYMSHFFANPLSVLLSDSELSKQDASFVCEAIRNTASFRREAERQIGEHAPPEGPEEVYKRLNDNSYLVNVAREEIEQGRKDMVCFERAVAAFGELVDFLKPDILRERNHLDIEFEIWSKPNFIASNLYHETMACLEALRSNQLVELMELFSRAKPGFLELVKEQDFRAQTMELEAFLTRQGCNSLRNTRDPTFSAMTATRLQSGKLPLGTRGSQYKSAEEAYTAVLDAVIHKFFERPFERQLGDRHPSKLYLREAFIYDLKTPLSTAFTPRPRYAIERALDRPGDYLGCECCAVPSSSAAGRAGEATAVAPTQPPTSILWKLYCEAGGIVNVRDLWEAFKAVLLSSPPARRRGGNDENGVERESETDEGNENEGPRKERNNKNEDEDEDDDDDDDDDPEREEDEVEEGEDGDAAKDRHAQAQAQALALFYRSLAELKLLGFVKASKRKPGVECVAKTVWRGL